MLIGLVWVILFIDTFKAIKTYENNYTKPAETVNFQVYVLIEVIEEDEFINLQKYFLSKIY